MYVTGRFNLRGIEMRGLPPPPLQTSAKQGAKSPSFGVPLVFSVKPLGFSSDRSDSTIRVQSRQALQGGQVQVHKALVAPHAKAEVLEALGEPGARVEESRSRGVKGCCPVPAEDLV